MRRPRDHARRVLALVLGALHRFQFGEASVAELQSSVEGAAGALDNAHAELRGTLQSLESDLETIRFAVTGADQAAAVRAKAARFLELAHALDLDWRRDHRRERARPAGDPVDWRTLVAGVDR